MDVHVALDLGGDTLKVIFAYKQGEKEQFGKVVEQPWDIRAIPAEAYYNSEQKLWYFGMMASMQSDESYLTVVKIKQLLMMLAERDTANKDEAQICQNNRQAYSSGHDYKLFEFLHSGEGEYHEAKGIIDYTKLFERSKFSAEQTPKQVCQGFFDYVAAVVNARLNLAQLPNHKLVLSVVYPPFVGDEYICELKRLVANAFGTNPTKISALSMTRALCIYAQKRNLLKNDDKALIFNISEDATFVVKASVGSNGLQMDGADGHLSPIGLGGRDIDRAIGDYVEQNTDSRANDAASYTEQYRFLNKIKTAKVYLSMKDEEEPVTIESIGGFANHYNFTRSEGLKICGINPDGSLVKDKFASKLFKYIQAELNNPNNKDVTHVFLSGGVVETYGLVKALTAQLKQQNDVEVLTFEDEQSPLHSYFEDGFNVYCHEDAVYAPAVGCAYASLNSITVEIVAALSYGTDASLDDEGLEGETVFSMLLPKGTIIDNKKDYAGDYTIGRNCTKHTPMLMMCTNLSADEIEAGAPNVKLNCNVFVAKNLVISNAINTSGRFDKDVRKELEKKIGFRCLNDAVGDSTQNDIRSYITYYVEDKGKERQVELTNIPFLPIKAGFKLDSEGRAYAFVENCADCRESTIVKVRFVDNKTERYVYAKDIIYRAPDFRFSVSGMEKEP